LFGDFDTSFTQPYKGHVWFLLKIERGVSLQGSDRATLTREGHPYDEGCEAIREFGVEGNLLPHITIRRSAAT